MSHSYILTYFAVRFSLTFIFPLNTSLLLSVLLFGSAETPFSGLFSFDNAFIRLFSSRQYNSARYSLGIKKTTIKNLRQLAKCAYFDSSSGGRYWSLPENRFPAICFISSNTCPHLHVLLELGIWK